LALQAMQQQALLDGEVGFVAQAQALLVQV
jgi:hypothetical protein